MSNIYDLADTWNAGGTTFAAIKMNVTNTASAAGSQLIDLQTGGTQRFGIRAPHISLGSDATPFLNLVDVWNTSGVAVGIKYNVTDTASNASSLLMDLQVGGQSRIKVSKAGVLDLAVGATSCFRINPVNTTTTDISQNNGSYILCRWSEASFSIGNSISIGATALAPDVFLERDAANIFAQRRTTNAQTLRVYGTYTDTSNYRRVSLAMTTAGVATLLPEGAGTGASGNVLHISGLPTSNPGPGILWNNAGTPAIGT